MPMARANDTSLEYFLAGPAAGQARHQLLLVHGWTYGARMWVRFQAELAAREIRSLAVNQRGMGASPATARDEDHAATQSALDLKALTDELGFDGFTMVGQCQGGLVAMRFLERFPEKVKSLILIASPTKPNPPADRAAFAEWVDRYPETANRAAFEANTLGLSDSERDRLFQDWISIPRPRLRGVRLVETEELAPVLAGVPIPMLYCYGDRDTTLPLSTAFRAYLALPEQQRSLQVFHGAEHMLPCLVPRQLAEVVSRFLDGRTLFEPAT
jgi:pimeloyl-ACP methyl ester carboxylesterase